METLTHLASLGRRLLLVTLAGMSLSYLRGLRSLPGRLMMAVTILSVSLVYLLECMYQIAPIAAAINERMSRYGTTPDRCEEAIKCFC